MQQTTNIEARDGAIVAFLGDREIRLRLDLAAIKRLEDKLKLGFFAVHGRMVRAECGLTDVVETLRQAMLGGGIAPDEAARLIGAYVDSRMVPLVEVYALAVRALSAAMFGLEGETKPLAEPASAVPPANA